MNGILEERQLTDYELEMLELQAEVPDKFDAELEFLINKESSDKERDIRYRSLSKGETAALVAASEMPIDTSSKHSYSNNEDKYVSREFVENLMTAFFEDKKKEEERRLAKKQEEEWQIQETLRELELKKSVKKPKKATTKKTPKAKPSKSTKD